MKLSVGGNFLGAVRALDPRSAYVQRLVEVFIEYSDKFL